MCYLKMQGLRMTAAPCTACGCGMCPVWTVSATACAKWNCPNCMHDRQSCEMTYWCVHKFVGCGLLLASSWLWVPVFWQQSCLYGRQEPSALSSSKECYAGTHQRGASTMMAMSTLTTAMLWWVMLISTQQQARALAQQPALLMPLLWMTQHMVVTRPVLPWKWQPKWGWPWTFWAPDASGSGHRKCCHHCSEAIWCWHTGSLYCWDCKKHLFW